MKSKFFSKQGEIIQYHRPSSIWSGIKDAIPEILSRSQWSIGNGVSTDLWRQNWLGPHSLKDRLQLSSADIANFKSKVASLLYNSTLLIPPQLHEVLLEAGLDNNNVLKDVDSEPDNLIWCPMINDKFSVKSAYSEIRETRHETAWAKFIWKAYIHPRVSAQAWTIIRN
ncbi:Ribonuclease h domain, partial [Thalictrum thalictroides]